MSCHNKFKYLITIITVSLIVLIIPMRASGKVEPITDLEDKLQNISDEEKAVLDDLFTIAQDIDAIEAKEKEITADISKMQKKIKTLENGIEKKQNDYDRELGILKQVLVNYQRSGPASYLEILFHADNLSSFLKTLNIMKDISHNVNKLLASLEDGKKVLQEEEAKLEEDNELLKQKKDELLVNLHKNEQLKKKQEDYLASLKEDRAYYQEQLDQVRAMWENCKKLFPGISKEITEIIGAGYFSAEDLNLKYGFFSISGYLKEDTFNKILTEHTKSPGTVFRFEDGKVVIEVPDQHLVLKGNFNITGQCAITFAADEGTFFELPIDDASIRDIFQNGPLTIDFESITGNIFNIDFKITEVESKEGTLDFMIVPQF